MTNEAIQNMLDRRSCRSFDSSRIISAEELDTILKAGTYAPTGRGSQSPIMVAIQDQALIKKLSRMNADIMGVPIDPFYGATTVIIVLADKNWPTHVYDGSLVMGNLLNAAASLGIGACWIHRAKEEFESDEGKALLKEWGIEGEYEGIGHCILGYPAGPAPEAAPRKADYITIIK
ncbi:MAG: nitroreductase family protein [Clostridia bacterium]|nr:nitroreductase family protein [Clostridia bacterium]